MAGTEAAKAPAARGPVALVRRSAQQYLEALDHELCLVWGCALAALSPAAEALLDREKAQ